MPLSNPLPKDLKSFEQSVIKKRIDVDLLKGVKNSIVDEYMNSIKHQEQVFMMERMKN